jgi:hypothetical protein
MRLMERCNIPSKIICFSPTYRFAASLFHPREERAERDFKEILAKRCKDDKIWSHAEENLVTFAQQQQLSL